jgi:hypothetical protein
VLGSFVNSPVSNGHGPLGGPLRSKAKETKKPDQTLNNLLERDWSELPYAMMRITAARRPWDGNRVYWRDRTVQLGEIDLNLVKNPAQGDTPRYTALYTHDELRRSFALHPSLEDGQLRWSAPGVYDAAQLTTDQLAEKLLARLVTFYTTGLSKTSPTSPASPDLSS